MIDHGYSVSTWQDEVELPDHDIRAICQDSDGFVWLGTSRGLVRFDGVKFDARRVNDAELPERLAVHATTADPAGGLYFSGDAAGLGVFHLTFRGGRPLLRSACATPNDRVLGIFKESARVLWLQMWNGDWTRVENRVEKRFPAPGLYTARWPASFAVSAEGKVFISRGFGVETMMPDGSLTLLKELPTEPLTICAASDGGLWIATGSKLYKWRARKLEFVVSLGTMDPNWPPTAILETADGGLWLATRNSGLRRWGNQELLTISTSHPSVRCLMEDNEGNLWAGTASGGPNLIRKVDFDVVATHAADTTGSFCQDSKGVRWLVNSRGIWRLVERSGEAALAFPQGTEPLEGQSVCPDQDGHVWIGSSKGLFRCPAGGSGVPELMPPGVGISVYSIFCASDGAVWVGCHEGPLLCYRGTKVESFGPAEGYNDGFAQAFCEDHEGRIWVGTRRGGLFVKRGERFERMEFPHVDLRPAIQSMLGDADGNVWIGTGGQGLLVSRNGRFSSINQVQGLPEHGLAQILEDDHGRMWFATQRMIFRVSKADLLLCADGKSDRVFPVVCGVNDGVQGFYATSDRQPSAWKTQSGRLWFVARRGLFTTQATSEKTPQKKPGVLIDEVLIDGRPVDEREVVRLRSHENNLKIHFAVPSFSYAKDFEFRYRLAGHDEGWTKVGDLRVAVFSGLSPGGYRFEVAASNARLGWELPPAVLDFEVEPRWWERASVKISIAIAAAIAVGLAVWLGEKRRMRMRMIEVDQERRIERERARIARDLHDGLGAGLTEVGLMAAEIRQDSELGISSGGTPGHLGDRIRSLARELDAAVWAASPRHDHLNSLCVYLCDYATEHFAHSSIKCLVDADESLPEMPLSPDIRHHLFMATREALNNALKHSGASEVTLGIHLVNRELRISVADNGVGISESAMEGSRRNGLRNMRERLAEVGGGFKIIDSPEGATVLITLAL